MYDEVEQVIIPRDSAFPAGVYRLVLHQYAPDDCDVYLINHSSKISVARGLDHTLARAAFRSLENKFKRQDFFPQANKMERIKAIREHYGPAFGLKAAKHLHESGLILTGDLVRDFSRLCERLPYNFQV